MKYLLASMHLYAGKRTRPICSGYRVDFRFIESPSVGGGVELLDKIELMPGETGRVRISIFNQEYLGDLDNLPDEVIMHEGHVDVGCIRRIELE